MTKPLLLLDRDGTVTRNRVRPGDYIRHPRELEPMPGVIKRLKVYAERGYRIALLSNQGGVERGVLTMDTCIDTFYQTFKILDYLVQAAWFCPSMSGSKGDVAFRLTMPVAPGLGTPVGCMASMATASLARAWPWRRWRGLGQSQAIACS